MPMGRNDDPDYLYRITVYSQAYDFKKVTAPIIKNTVMERRLVLKKKKSILKLTNNFNNNTIISNVDIVIFVFAAGEKNRYGYSTQSYTHAGAPLRHVQP